MKRTGFHQHTISQLSLGTIQLGMDYGISNTAGAPGTEQAFGILDVARQAGINTFDTARTYGSAEEVLGNYFRQNPLRNDFLISKFKYDWTPGITIEEAWEATKSSIQRSLRELQIGQLPLALYHKGPQEPMEEVLRIVPVLLNRLKEEGYILHGGISLYYTEDARHTENTPAFEALQIPLNVLDQGIIGDGTLKSLHDNGKLLFIRSVFLQGLLFREPSGLSGVLAKAVPYLNGLRSLAHDSGRTIAELAFAFIRDLPEADSLVIGAETSDQVIKNLELLDSPPLPDALRSELEALAVDVPKEVITPGLWR